MKPLCFCKWVINYELLRFFLYWFNSAYTAPFFEVFLGKIISCHITYCVYKQVLTHLCISQFKKSIWHFNRPTWFLECLTRRSWESWDCSALKKSMVKARLSSVYNDLTRKGSRDGSTRSWSARERTIDSRCRNYRNFKWIVKQRGLSNNGTSSPHRLWNLHHLPY